jgi:hypothetical protein
MHVSMNRSRRMARRTLVALLALGGVVTLAPNPASAEPTPGTCTGTALTSTPRSSSHVTPGQRITYRLDIVVTGGSPVVGCARDLLVSPLLGFVSAAPGGAYWPGTTNGPVAEVSFTGPFAPGTHLHGQVVTRVRAGIPPGALITSTSGGAVWHLVTD